MISDFVKGIRDTVKAANAGCDIEMCNTNFYGKRLIDAVQSGLVPESSVATSAERIVRTVLKFKRKEDPLPEYPKNLLGCAEHKALALEVAHKSLVLLQNNRNNLPWSLRNLHRIVVLGALSKSKNTGDHGSSRVFPRSCTSVLMAMRNFCSLAGIDVTYNDGSNLDSAKELARTCDGIILVYDGFLF